MFDMEPGAERTLAIAACIKQIGSEEAYRVVGSHLDMQYGVLSRIPVPCEMYSEMFVAFAGLDFAKLLSTKRIFRQDLETGEISEILKLDIEDDDEDGGIL